MRRAYLVVGSLSAIVVGCASNGGMERPFVFNEARLPADFPPPGPVGEIIEKQYPVYRMARVRGGEGEVAGGAGGMFRPLFDHIKRNDIPMTAPVEIGYADDVDVDSAASSMAFLYGDPSWGSLGADADDRRVVVEEVPAATVVSIGVRGAYTGANFRKAVAKLRAWVEQHAGVFRVMGPPRYLAYNSPFVLAFMKYGEVQLPVEPLGRN